jgi:maleylacetoacetate isomerase
MSDLKLHNYFRSSTSFRVRIALEVKQLPYEYIPVHLLNGGGEQNKPEYRKLNPMGGVPTLVHKDFTLAQSDAIIEYLDEAFPQTHSLFPKNIQQKAKVREFCQIINADIHSYGNLKTLQYLEKNFSATEEVKNKWVQDWFTQGLSACEIILKKSAGIYSFSDTLTTADCFLVPLVFTANRFKVDLTGFKNINKVNENCLKLSSFQKAHPYRQPDTPNELKMT